MNNDLGHLMKYQQFVDSLDDKTINKLKTAVEIGRWENGDKLSEQQRESAMQAVMLWQAKHEVNSPEEPFKVNEKGEFKIGKGDAVNDTPPEFKVNDDPSLIFRSKG
jgi:uncharacterized protein YeaC (DUF1315 family)